MGGMLTDVLSWPWIFFVNVPIGVGTALAALRCVPESRAPMLQRRFDLAGAMTVTSGLVVLVYAIVKAESKGWGSLHTLGLAPSRSRCSPPSCSSSSARSPRSCAWRSSEIRTLAVANGSLFVVVGGLYGMFFFASLYVQRILGYSPLEAGLAFLPVTVGIIAGAGRPSS